MLLLLIMFLELKWDCDVILAVNGMCCILFNALFINQE